MNLEKTRPGKYYVKCEELKSSQEKNTTHHRQCAYEKEEEVIRMEIPSFLKVLIGLGL